MHPFAKSKSLPNLIGSNLTIIQFFLLRISQFVKMKMGLFTQPVGLKISAVTSGITDPRLSGVFRARFLWILFIVFALNVITHVPAFNLWLPKLM